jgi:hypothetical protein
MASAVALDVEVAAGFELETAGAGFEPDVVAAAGFDVETAGAGAAAGILMAGLSLLTAHFAWALSATPGALDIILGKSPSNNSK